MKYFYSLIAKNKNLSFKMSLLSYWTNKDFNFMYQLFADQNLEHHIGN